MDMAEQEALVGDLAIPPRPQVVTLLVETLGYSKGRAMACLTTFPQLLQTNNQPV